MNKQLTALEAALVRVMDLEDEVAHLREVEAAARVAVEAEQNMATSPIFFTWRATQFEAAMKKLREAIGKEEA